MEKMRLMTNVMDLIECQDIQNLMTVNGFSQSGSAYDRFLSLCLCAERQPGTPIVSQIENYLREEFGRDFAINSSTCPEIWRETSENLLLGDVAPKVLRTVEKKDVCLPMATDFNSQKCFSLNDLRLDANEWSEWRREAEAILCRVLQEGGIVSVTLPASRLLAKTSLYQANRVIAEREWNHPAWITQLVYFLCDFCTAYNVRGCIFHPVGGVDLCKILQHVSKQTRLPNLYVGCAQPQFDALLPICRMILSERADKQKGVPPLLLVNPS